MEIRCEYYININFYALCFPNIGTRKTGQKAPLNTTILSQTPNAPYLVYHNLMIFFPEKLSAATDTPNLRIPCLVNIWI